MIESEWKITFSMSGEAWAELLTCLKEIKKVQCHISTMRVNRIEEILKIKGLKFE